MRRLGMLAVLLTAVTMSGLAFGDVETYNFDATMQELADFPYEGGNPYLYLDPDGYWKDDYDDEDPHEWVDPCDNNLNGIYDAVEFAVLSAIFADTAAPNHTEVHEGWKANVTQVGKDLGALAGALAPDLKYVMAAYATLGDGSFGRYYDAGPPVVNVGFGFVGSWGIMAETIYGMAEYGSQWYKGAPDEAKYSRLQDLVAACGDADGDDARNIGEFLAAGGNDFRAAYVAAALDDGTSDDDGDPEGVCIVAPPNPMPGLYWYNPDTQSVYTINPVEVTFDAAEAAAVAWEIEGTPMPGHLVSIKSAAEMEFLMENILQYFDTTMHIGAHDKTVEGDWEWTDEPGVVFWRGKGSGATPPGGPVEGRYSNWNGTGEPNDSGGVEDECEIRGAEGNWNDNNDKTHASIVEFAGPFEDSNCDGLPDDWEEWGTPDPEASCEATVPNVVGQTQTAATATLVALELAVIVQTDYSDTVAVDLVISQDPVGGTLLAGVTTVTIVVSLGEEPEIFLTQPVGGWFEAGDSLTLEAELYAPVGTATYQWQKNQGDMPGEEDPELVFDPLEESDEGHYRCVATDESAKGEFISDEVYVLVAAEGMLPVAAGAGLALLSGVCALAGAAAVRRKK